MRKLRASVAVIALFAASPALAQNAKVSTLIPVTTPLTGAELFYVVQGGVSKSMTFSAFQQSGSASLAVGSSAIIGGTSGDIEFNNGGKLGEKSVTGTGSVVLSQGPTITGSFTATGLVTNADLVNPSLTLGSTSVALGSTTATIAALGLTGVTNFTMVPTPGTLQASIEGSSDGQWSIFGNPAFLVTNHNAANTIVGEYYSDYTGHLTLGTGVTGFAYIPVTTGAGTYAFGLYGDADIYASTGAGIAGEATCRNYAGVPSSGAPLGGAFPVSGLYCNGLQITTGGPFAGTGGIVISNNGAYAAYWNFGIYLSSTSVNTGGYGYYQDSQGVGSNVIDMDLNNNGTGINLILGTTGTATPGNAVFEVLNASSVAHLSIDQAGDLTMAGALSVGNHILAATTSPAISACGTGSPTVTGSDTFGKIVAGGGALTSCVVNFGTAFVTAPDCVVSGTSSIAGLDVTASTTQLTIGGTSLTGVTITFHCGSVS